MSWVMKMWFFAYKSNVAPVTNAAEVNNKTFMSEPTDG